MHRLADLLRASTGGLIRLHGMRVAVVDVGANTLRLLVSEADDSVLVPIREERKRTSLGEDVERFGRLTPEKIASSADAARQEIRRARKLGATRVEVVVTSPWRNAENGAELVAALRESTGVTVRPLSGEEEGELGFIGALARTPVDAEPVAVCDVGGGSAQLTVGSRSGPEWSRSIPVGSLRLTERCLHSDPPESTELAAAREVAAGDLAGFEPPAAKVALATGGTARALRRFGLESLDEVGLDAAIEELAALPVEARASRAQVDPERARTLPAGAIILRELARLVVVPMQIADGGVREGVCSELFRADAATG